MLEQIRQSHSLVYRHFSAMEGGEEHLAAIRALDRYWQQLDRPPETVVRDGGQPPAAETLSGDFDIVYAGGTLGMLHAAVMARRYGYRVLVFDRGEPARTTRDWNISRTELLRLAETGVFSTDELESVIVRRYRTGWVEFHAPEPRRKRLYIDDVLDCAVDADRLLGIAMQKVLEAPGSKVLARTSFTGCRRFADALVVDASAADGQRLSFRARVLVDAMGIVSPVAMQLNGGRPQTHVCPTVGTIATGLEGVDPEVGEILASVEPAERTGNGCGRQLIWEGFPSMGESFVTYLFFYDRVDSPNDKSLLGLFETYFRKLPGYRKPGPAFTIDRPVYGIIPAYFHDGTGCTRVVADDRIVLLGDAASLASPLTFCGFGSLVRNLARMTEGLDRAMRSGDLRGSSLAAASQFEHHVAAMANLMKYMCYDARTDEPDFVNELMNEVMIVLDALPVRYRQAMFRDEMTLDELLTVMLRVSWRYPRIFRATWDKLGMSGTVGFLKNLAGWAMAPAPVAKRG